MARRPFPGGQNLSHGKACRRIEIMRRRRPRKWGSRPRGLGRAATVRTGTRDDFPAGEPHTTNNRMEMAGRPARPSRADRAVRRHRPFRQPLRDRRHDPEVVARYSRRRGWSTPAACRNRCTNGDLWHELIEAARPAPDRPDQWVKRGPTAHPYETNDVDQLASDTASRTLGKENLAPPSSRIEPRIEHSRSSHRANGPSSS